MPELPPDDAEKRPTVTDRPATDKKAAEDAEFVSWSRMAGIGVEFIASFGVFAAIGWFADKKLNTGPWLLIVGCGLGFTGGLWNMLKTARKMMG